MSFQQVSKFFEDLALWQKVVAGLIVAVIVALAAFFKRIFKRKGQSEFPTAVRTITKGTESPAQSAIGSEIKQSLTTDRSHREGAGINIERIESGATLNVKVINYVDGLPDTPVAKVRSLFEKGSASYIKNEFQDAIRYFTLCLELEKDAEKRGALNLQIGNCYYELRRYIKAAEFYSAGLRESRKANDVQGQASNLASIANTYILRPAYTGKVRGKNVQDAVQKYNMALQIFLKDEYPVQYATTQNNLGNAYTELPSATAEQRAENVRNAIECYQAALEIYKKDEYPFNYAMTQNNLGSAYTDLPSATPEQRAENVRNSIECYQAALEIYKKAEYPVQYATNQNNLGNAYKYLPSATPEQRAENVRNAIECYQAALEIYKKDEYPQDYCFTAANIGLILAEINDKKNACYWLKESYSLRQFLPDQGKRLEYIMSKVCDQE